MRKLIRVHVLRIHGCTSWIARWVDSTTGRQRKKSTGTTDKRTARRLAHEWEQELNSGKPTASDISWEAFRERYEREVLPGLAPMTGQKVGGVFNTVERHLPTVASGKLADLTAERLSAYQAALREAGRSESTVAGHLAHLMASLRWAADQGLLPEAPKVRKPRRAKSARASSPMKGRPISGEEFDRLVGALPKALGPGVDPAPWERLLLGLWWSGLRLGEALNLWWDRPDRPCIDLTGRRPMLRIPGEHQKNHQDQLCPVAPEFAELLESTPEADRRGRVFPIYAATARVQISCGHASKVISAAGRLAGIRVWLHPVTGRPKFASAIDLRRSFASRWALRLNSPFVLMRLMRHENIRTTMAYYVHHAAETIADAIYAHTS